MSKVRIYELAKDLNISSKELVEKAKTIGMEVENHRSAITKEEAQQLKAEFENREVIQTDGHKKFQTQRNNQILKKLLFLLTVNLKKFGPQLVPTMRMKQLTILKNSLTHVNSWQTVSRLFKVLLKNVSTFSVQQIKRNVRLIQTKRIFERKSFFDSRYRD